MQENEIVFPEDFFIREVSVNCEKIKELIEFRGFEKISLNFERVLKCFPDTMLPLIAFLIRYQNEGVRFNLISPRDASLEATFVSANWCHLIDPKKFKSFEDIRRGRFSARRFVDPAEQHDVVNGVIDRMLRTTTFLERPHLRALEWAINEITDNVLQHSKTTLGGVIQLTLKPNAKEIEFIISDCGIGIPYSLREGLANSWSDSRALEESVKEGVTSGAGQGNGLFGSIQIAAESGGAFSINSGSAYLMLSRDGRTKISTGPTVWPGTSIDCSINYSKPLVLERALRFNNTPHVPRDLLDSKYEAEEDDLTFELRNETSSIGSRVAGFEARRKLENLIQFIRPNRVVLDCSQLSIMSSSFADEFFAKLVVKYGEAGFSNLFRVSDLHDTNFLIIDRSVRQRIGVSFNEIIKLAD